MSDSDVVAQVGEKDFAARNNEKQDVTPEETEFHHGHLTELEVDLDKTLNEVGIDEVDSEHSPYPEGGFRRGHEQPAHVMALESRRDESESLTLVHSSCGGARGGRP